MTPARGPLRRVRVDADPERGFPLSSGCRALRDVRRIGAPAIVGGHRAHHGVPARKSRAPLGARARLANLLEPGELGLEYLRGDLAGDPPADFLPKTYSSGLSI